MDAMAAAAKDTMTVGSMAADSVGAAETTNEAAEAAPPQLSLWRKAHARLSAAVSRRREHARQARVGRHRAGKRTRAQITCKLPPLGRVGHVGCARSLMCGSVLMSLLLSTSPCLMAGTPAVIMHA